MGGTGPGGRNNKGCQGSKPYQRPGKIAGVGDHRVPHSVLKRSFFAPFAPFVVQIPVGLPTEHPEIRPVVGGKNAPDRT